MHDTSVGESPPLWDDRRQAGLALAATLGLPMATWCVRKVADPANPELAIGAVGPGDVTLWRIGTVGSRHEAAAHSGGWLRAEQHELERRRWLFGDPEPAVLRGLPLVVVDDGVATGMTLCAALDSLRRCGPASLELAVPVAGRQVLASLAPLVDRITVLAAVADLDAVGVWYRRFDQLSDGEVLALLAAARRP